MSSDEWEDDEAPTNILDNIGRFLFPKKKSKKVKEQDPILPPTNEVEELSQNIGSEDKVPTAPEILPEPKPEPIKEDKKSKNHKKKEKSDDDWVDDEKPKKHTVEPDLSRGLPGNLQIKRVVATILFLFYSILLILVFRGEVFSTIISIVTIIILLDYLAITRGKTEQWG